MMKSDHNIIKVPDEDNNDSNLYWVDDEVPSIIIAPNVSLVDKKRLRSEDSAKHMFPGSEDDASGQRSSSSLSSPTSSEKPRIDNSEFIPDKATQRELEMELEPRVRLDRKSKNLASQSTVKQVDEEVEPIDSDNELETGSIHSADFHPKKKRPKKQRESKEAKKKEARKADFHEGNNHQQPRKLLVFDLNKVLIFRKQYSSQYKLRPHATEFLRAMAKRFKLGVWTSMSKNCAKPIINELFHFKNIPILFQWYQKRCDKIIVSDVYDAKPLFMKHLSSVWRTFHHYGPHNTLLIDDTVEKCSNNPPYTSLHPKPFELCPSVFNDAEYHQRLQWKRDEKKRNGHNHITAVSSAATAATAIVVAEESVPLTHNSRESNIYNQVKMDKATAAVAVNVADSDVTDVTVQPYTDGNQTSNAIEPPASQREQSSVSPMKCNNSSSKLKNFSMNISDSSSCSESEKDDKEGENGRGNAGDMVCDDVRPHVPPLVTVTQPETIMVTTTTVDILPPHETQSAVAATSTVKAVAGKLVDKVGTEAESDSVGNVDKVESSAAGASSEAATLHIIEQQQEEEEEEDNELRIDGALFNYLDALSKSNLGLCEYVAQYGSYRFPGCSEERGGVMVQDGTDGICGIIDRTPAVDCNEIDISDIDATTSNNNNSSYTRMTAGHSGEEAFTTSSSYAANGPSHASSSYYDYCNNNSSGTNSMYSDSYHHSVQNTNYNGHDSYSYNDNNRNRHQNNNYNASSSHNFNHYSNNSYNISHRSNNNCYQPQPYSFYPQPSYPVQPAHNNRSIYGPAPEYDYSDPRHKNKMPTPKTNKNKRSYKRAQLAAEAAAAAVAEAATSDRAAASSEGPLSSFAASEHQSITATEPVATVTAFVPPVQQQIPYQVPPLKEADFSLNPRGNLGGTVRRDGMFGYHPFPSTATIPAATAMMEVKFYDETEQDADEDSSVAKWFKMK